MLAVANALPARVICDQEAQMLGLFSYFSYQRREDDPGGLKGTWQCKIPASSAPTSLMAPRPEELQPEQLLGESRWTTVFRPGYATSTISSPSATLCACHRGPFPSVIVANSTCPSPLNTSKYPVTNNASCVNTAAIARGNPFAFPYTNNPLPLRSVACRSSSTSAIPSASVTLSMTTRLVFGRDATWSTNPARARYTALGGRRGELLWKLKLRIMSSLVVVSGTVMLKGVRLVPAFEGMTGGLGEEAAAGKRRLMLLEESPCDKPKLLFSTLDKLTAPPPGSDGASGGTGRSTESQPPFKIRMSS